MNIFRTILFWILVVFLSFGFFCIIAFCKIIFLLVGYKNPDRFAHFIATLWGRAYFFFIPGWRMVLKGKENLPPKNEAVVYVSNHQSMTDILAMYYLGRQFRWLSKDTVFKVPVIGQTMKWAGYIPIIRGNRNSMQLAMSQARMVLERGFSMFFFPEGTRSETLELRPFKVGAFRLAQDANTSVVPLTLHGTGDLMPKGSAMVHPATVYMTIHPPMRQAESESNEEFGARVREIVSTELNVLRQNSVK